MEGSEDAGYMEEATGYVEEEELQAQASAWASAHPELEEGGKMRVASLVPIDRVREPVEGEFVRWIDTPCEGAAPIPLWLCVAYVRTHK
jgi:hypothetical protein